MVLDLQVAAGFAATVAGRCYVPSYDHRRQRGNSGMTRASQRGPAPLHDGQLMNERAYGLTITDRMSRQRTHYVEVPAGRWSGEYDPYDPATGIARCGTRVELHTMLREHDRRWRPAMPVCERCQRAGWSNPAPPPLRYYPPPKHITPEQAPIVPPLHVNQMVRGAGPHTAAGRGRVISLLKSPDGGAWVQFEAYRAPCVCFPGEALPVDDDPR
jgi:hypothetical protein